MSRYPGARTFATYPSRFGPGKVHRYVYNVLNGIWYPACREPHHAPLHGEALPALTPVTCSKCGIDVPADDETGRGNIAELEMAARTVTHYGLE